jgi:hypothetical protein
VRKEGPRAKARKRTSHCLIASRDPLFFYASRQRGRRKLLFFKDIRGRAVISPLLIRKIRAENAYVSMA